MTPGVAPAVGGESMVYGITPEDEVVRLLGGESRDSDYWGITVDGDLVLRRENGDWIVLDAPELDLISAGADGTLFGIGGDRVFRYDGAGWTVVNGPAMRDVSVGSDGTVFALGPTANADNVFEYVGDR